MLAIRKLTYALFLFFSLVTSAVAVGQTKFRVSGKVTQSAGEPLAGATITEKGASSSVVTKED
ncbi:MAG TPA: hypothetical protein VG605_23170, partial [Puia sp.]|nr:hypothetical protein [Puia sp.]